MVICPIEELYCCAAFGLSTNFLFSRGDFTFLRFQVIDAQYLCIIIILLGYFLNFMSHFWLHCKYCIFEVTMNSQLDVFSFDWLPLPTILYLKYQSRVSCLWNIFIVSFVAKMVLDDAYASLTTHGTMITICSFFVKNLSVHSDNNITLAKIYNAVIK